MSDSEYDGQLINYRLFMEKIDSWLYNLDDKLKVDMKCGPGCSGCCRNFTVSAVEAYSMGSYMKKNGIKREIFSSVDIERSNIDSDEPCIFLEKDLCRIYPARPLICRTHGYPIVVKSGGGSDGGEIEIDHCPLNFSDFSFERELLIDLDHINTVLFSVNSLFLKEMKASCSSIGPIYDRFSFGDIVRHFSL